MTATVLINNVLLNLLCVWIHKQKASITCTHILNWQLRHRCPSTVDSALNRPALYCGCWFSPEAAAWISSTDKPQRVCMHWQTVMSNSLSIWLPKLPSCTQHDQVDAGHCFADWNRSRFEDDSDRLGMEETTSANPGDSIQNVTKMAPRTLAGGTWFSVNITMDLYI